MKKRLISIWFLFLLVSPAPLAILTVPQPAHAQFASIVAVAEDFSFTNVMTMIRSTISSIAEVSTAINEYAMWVKTWILDPIAFILSGNMLRAITAGVVDFINGGNASGNPLYVRNLSQHLLSLNDQQALGFFGELGHSNAPFGATILNSLRINYLQNTSGAGFWGANQCTLNQFSANPAAFMAGDFNQGGWTAWFALTTQPQNNPYTFYYRAQAELYSRTAQITHNTLSQLGWGSGFMSWCGDAESTPAPAGSPGCAAGETYSNEFQTCVPNSVAAIDGQCTKQDGTNGHIQTPGSVIKDSLQKALGTDIDRLILTGDVATIFQNIQNTMQILAYGANLLGAGGSGGLFGASQGGAGSTVQRYLGQPVMSAGAVQNNATAQQTAAASQSQTQGTNGATTIGSGVSTSGAGFTRFSGGAAGGAGGAGAGAGAGFIVGSVTFSGGGGGDVTAFMAALQTIENGALGAKIALSTTSATCSGTEWGTNADTALSTVVNPLIGQLNTAATVIPSANDVLIAQAQAQLTLTATTPSCGSLIANGGTLFDQMRLLIVNANGATQACQPPGDPLTCPL